MISEVILLPRRKNEFLLSLVAKPIFAFSAAQMMMGFAFA